MKISFCLITLNEEKNLPRCLASCAGLADEIIVLDSGSTDATEKIARQFGARFEHQDWLGFVGQKNRVLSLATRDWIFSLDADEELSPELRAEILSLKNSGAPSHNVNGYSMPRCVLYEGRWIRHGDWYPDRLVRLFRRDHARFAGGNVHERLEISGPVQDLHGDLHHYSFADAATTGGAACFMPGFGRRKNLKRAKPQAFCPGPARRRFAGCAATFCAAVFWTARKAGASRRFARGRPI